MDEFDIYIRSFGSDRAEPAESGLCRVFGLDPRRAREFVQSLPRIVKRNVGGEQIDRYARVLRELGADFELRRSAIRPAHVIAVAGEERPADELHGGTLTLPPPQFADPARAAPDGGPAAAQFAATLVDPGPPAALVAELERAALARTTVEPDRFATVREADPARIAAQPPPPEFTIEKPPASAARAAPTAAGAWGSLSREPLPVRAPAAATSALAPPAPPAAIAGIDLPLPSAPPEQAAHGRPDWLVAGANLYRHPEVVASSAAELRSAAPHAQVASHAPAAPHGPWSVPLAGAPVRPVELASPPRAHGATRPAPKPQHAPRSTGVVLGREAAPDPPLLLRVGLRVVLGITLFLMLAALRSALDSDVQRALAAWANEETSSASSDDARAAESRAAYGPRALAWMASDLHQFTNGDKDAVRARVRAYKAAGAVEVYVGNIMRSGPIALAGELIVELPADPARRKAVLDEHQRRLAAQFGGFAPSVADDGKPVLRVTL